MRRDSKGLRRQCNSAAAHEFHQPAVEIGEHVASEAIIAGVLPKGDGATGDMKQAQIAADVVGWVSLAVAGCGEEAGNMPYVVDAAEGAEARGKWTVDSDNAGESL